MADPGIKTESPNEETRPQDRSRGHMVFLFFSLIVVILLAPLLESDTPGHLILPVAFIAILISGIYAVSDSFKQRLIAILLGIPLIIGFVVAEFVETKANTSPIALTLGVPFFIFITYRLLIFVAKARRVTDTMMVLVTFD